MLSWQLDLQVITLSSTPLWFFLLSNVAVTARSLIDDGARVAIFDWDVNHGNGTQDVSYSSQDLFYILLHQAGICPGVGHLHEVGDGEGAGKTVNVPLPRFSSVRLHRVVTDQLLVLTLAEFDPDWILVFAGYDAHERDPLGSLRLATADYMASRLAGLVAYGGGIVFLEGGYDLDALE